MNHSTTPHPALSGFLVTVFALMSAFTACSPSKPEPPPPSLASSAAAAPQQRHFTGVGSLAGTRQSLDMGPGHHVEVFRLGGSLMLTGEQRLGLAFRSEVIGLSDNQTGMLGRSVWTDERSEQIFGELGSATTGPDNLIQGRIIGGTGRFAGVSGEYSFKWHPLVVSEDGSVSGRIVDLKGWVRLASPPSPAGTVVRSTEVHP